ncbi:hypothetical protein COL22_02055 [Bacillus thuringiensis]|uniref:hypothetical protein n=1 Tax=Bacillus thuringiensis TaxID=1428 RepID=UPI000BF3DAD6|nr:hypothetical protein [Bacillus thuringiensis]PFW16445.1 hypothetical protein COL22_02055 [Bacillus thuringiensis]
MQVQLTNEQKQLREVIAYYLKIAKNWENTDYEIIEDAFMHMKLAAHKLHMQLEPKPKHHNYMIKNRGMRPEEPDFYNHIHPVEDLLSYLDDTSANDDPIDSTLGCTFEFNVYSNRWGHRDRYELTRTENGWHVRHLTFDGTDSLDNMATLYAAMSHDGISFPSSVKYYFSSIWMIAQDEGLEYNQVQEMINRVADWISQTEMNAPRDILI